MGFPSPGTKKTVRVIMKSPYEAGVPTAGLTVYIKLSNSTVGA